MFGPFFSSTAVAFVLGPAVKKQSSVRLAQDDEGWAYETQKIEAGSVLLNAGFCAVTQQHLYKSVVLILEHGEAGTRGIVVNRPSSRAFRTSSRAVGQWSLWFGGTVENGGMFSAEQATGMIAANIDCLTARDFGDEDFVVIGGVKWCKFSTAMRLVEVGKAVPEDFWVFCGYVAWGPGQLAAGLGKSWRVAATNTLIDELSKMRALDDGTGTWERLMERIGRAKDVEDSQDAFADGMLRVWRDERLGPTRDRTLDAASKQRRDDALRLLRGPPGEPAIPLGALFAGTAVGSDFVADRQYLHKSLLLVIDNHDDRIAAVTLNRAFSKRTVTLNVTESAQVEFALAFGGELVPLHQETFWLTFRTPMEGDRPVGPLAGDLKPAVLSTNDAAYALRSGFYVEDIVAITGLSTFTVDEFERLLGVKALVPLRNDHFPWDDIFAMHHQSTKNPVGDGASVWTKAIENAKVQADDDDDLPPTPLADEALAYLHRNYLI